MNQSLSILNDNHIKLLRLKFKGRRQELADKAGVHYNTVCAFLATDEAERTYNDNVAAAIQAILEIEGWGTLASLMAIFQPQQNVVLANA